MFSRFFALLLAVWSFPKEKSRGKNSHGELVGFPKTSAQQDQQSFTTSPRYLGAQKHFILPSPSHNAESSVSPRSQWEVHQGQSLPGVFFGGKLSLSPFPASSLCSVVAARFDLSPHSPRNCKVPRRCLVTHQRHGPTQCHEIPPQSPSDIT